MRKSKAGAVALGGMLTAVAVVIMSMGSLIPVNTYICPTLCILITRPIINLCGRRIAGCYYAAVSLLSLLLAPDREAAVMYVFLGYYPLIKPLLDRIKNRVLRMAAKIALFAAAGGLAYGLLIFVFGADALMAEFQQMGAALLIVMVILWEVLLILVDRLLGMPIRRRRK